MTINISEIQYEETFVGLYGDVTHYFIAPKKLIEDNYPDCDHATISIERDDRGGYTCMISPTAGNLDYDWKYFDLDNECADALMKMVPQDKVESEYNPVLIAYNLLVNLLVDMGTKNVDEAHITDVVKDAKDYLWEALE